MKLCYLIVTYNRLEKLKKLVSSLEKQYRVPDYIIIYNNCSTDKNYKNYLNNWLKQNSSFKKIIINAITNTGGAGGFYNGIKDSLKLDYDYIIISDDDTFLELNALKIFEDFCINHPDYGSVCLNTIENNSSSNFHRIKKTKVGLYKVDYIFVKEQDYENGYCDIEMASFVGVGFKKEIFTSVGLPNKDYFIHMDDYEFFSRVKKRFRIANVKDAVIYHDYKEKKSISWINYYDFRNNLYFLKNILSPFGFYIAKLLYLYKMGKNKKKNPNLYIIQKDAYKDFKSNVLGPNHKYLK